MFVYWLEMLNSKVKSYQLNLIFLTFVGLQRRSANSLVTIQQHADLASLLFQVQVSVTWCLDCVKVFMCAKSFDTPPHAFLWTAHTAAPITEHGRVQVWFPAGTYESVTTSCISTLVRTQCLAVHSANWVIFVLAACCWFQNASVSFWPLWDPDGWLLQWVGAVSCSGTLQQYCLRLSHHSDFQK